MKQQQFLIPTLLLLLGLCSAFDEKSVPDVADYISKYKEIAIEEMYRSGIPASITLAQGLHESGIGKGQLAVNSNNHFGIKCKKNWKGESFYWKDDDKDANGKLIESCFRVYPSVRQSYMDHTDFLLNNQRYKILFSYDRTDYVSWAKGLKTCGYATDEKYADKLIATIKRYNLAQFDVIHTLDNDLVIEDEDEAYDTVTETNYFIPEENYTIPQAEPIPSDYERHMFEQETPVVAPMANAATAPQYIVSVPVTNANATSTATQAPTTTVAVTVEEEVKPMLIPEDMEPAGSTIDAPAAAPMAPSYNIAAFAATDVVEETPTVTTTVAPAPRVAKKRDRLIQLVRKPRISKKTRQR